MFKARDEYYIITDECTACEACVPECPEEAIIIDDDHKSIDNEKCTACDACVDVCPAEAIKSFVG